MQQSQRHPRGHQVQRRPPRRLRWRLLLGRSAAGAAQRAQQQREQHGVAAAHVENELREVEWQVKFLETLDDAWLIHYDCCDWLWFTADSLLIDPSKKMNGCWKMSGDILPFCCWYFEGVQESCGDCWGDTHVGWWRQTHVEMRVRNCHSTNLIPTPIPTIQYVVIFCDHP